MKYADAVSALDREVEVLKLRDQLTWLGMVNVARPSYEDEILVRAQLNLQAAEIRAKLRALGTWA